ncbi:MAG: 2-dehydropantoate 2-reductase [Candidatus Promineifilaceae bacterium]|nr:2-dehydropantoate 2-reductase [Candidatus Promineifilaceae bacterium]
MRILVYGAGAVGGYLGATLAEQGHEVALITRLTMVELIGDKGLTLVRPDQSDVRVQPELYTSVRQALLTGRDYDVILLTMKSYDVAEALNALIAFYPDEAYPPIITLQNGIGIEEMVKEQLGTERVIAGSLTTPVSRETPERIRVERADRGLGLAATRRGQRVKEWVDLFAQAGITTVSFKDHRPMKWSKALLNMVGNATSAIVNRHPRAIYKYGPTFELEMEMLSEALAVMRAQKLAVVDLPGAQASRLAFAVNRLPSFVVKPVLSRLVAAGRGDKLPSFHIDLAAGKEQNEVLYHNGAVAAAGNRVGVSTPVNEALADILLKMARGEVDWQIYDGSPDRLVQEVEGYKRRAE